MAKGGGGAWKVAYADFVTAMMAFFLVMWITAQDQKIKQAVSLYFTHPYGDRPAAMSNKEGQRGDVPASKTTPVGTGRDSYTEPGVPSATTKLVGDHIFAEPDQQEHWRKQAKECRDLAAQSPDVLEHGASVEVTASKLLAARLMEEFKKKVPAAARGIHRELLETTIGDINWNEIAEDILRHLE